MSSEQSLITLRHYKRQTDPGEVSSEVRPSSSWFDDLSSMMNYNRPQTPGGGSQQVLDYLKRMQAENPAFCYAVETSNDHRTGNMFWADPAARLNYSNFGDAVVFDMPYRSGSYRVPFASFTGINHHGQPVLFGCALLSSESESSFIWLFESWLTAMSGRYPVSITTDTDRLVQVAVVQVLPRTRHRFSKRGIFRETKEKLASIYQSHPTSESSFKKCIDEPDSIEEFELSWASFLARYYLMDNEWLKSIYNARQQWVPAYMRDAFFGELSLPDESESPYSFFEGFINASTTIQMLVKQYEKAVASWNEKELKAEHDTTNTTPVLKTPSPMEKQAANVYTKRIFMKFQEELVETLANPATKIDDSGSISTYRVAKFGEDNKAHTVKFDTVDIKATCSCQRFEFSGIICRHILAVFRAKNVLTLPSHYILKRWTRNAKSGAVLNENASYIANSYRESLTDRYNNLREEAIKFVEEGAKSIQKYNVAMDALKEAGKKVAAAKLQTTGDVQDSSLINGSSHSGDENRIGQERSMDDKWKKICEMTAELDSVNQKCVVYRANLLSILKDMEDQKLKLAVKVQNSRLGLKE